jgi:hypothetical protein
VRSGSVERTGNLSVRARSTTEQPAPASCAALCRYTLLRDGEVVVYNGHPSATEKGCSKNAIDRMGPGFATRAVLVDMPLLKGVEWLDPHAPIYPEDLEAWEKFANVKIGSGDAVLIRTGRWALRAARGPWPQAREAAGLHAS